MMMHTHIFDQYTPPRTFLPSHFRKQKKFDIAARLQMWHFNGENRNYTGARSLPRKYSS
jgi:hypothetical protein